MSKKNLIIIITIIIVILLLASGRQTKTLVNPGGLLFGKKVETTPAPTIAPPNAPRTYKFDESTDLKMELDKVDPQILDSDFE